MVRIHNASISSQAVASTSTTTITTTSNNNSTNASGTSQVLPKLEIPASTTIQIQSSNPSLTNTAQVCIDAMPLADVEVRTFTCAKFSCHHFFINYFYSSAVYCFREIFFFFTFFHKNILETYFEVYQLVGHQISNRPPKTFVIACRFVTREQFSFAFLINTYRFMGIVELNFYAEHDVVI